MFFYRRLTIAGASLAGAGAALYAASALPAGDPTAPLFVPLTVAILAVVVFLIRTPRALWVPLVVGAPALAVFATDPFRLLHPDSFIDFVPSVLMVIGISTALVASAVALYQRRRGSERHARSSERRGIAAVAASVLALTAWSAVLTFSSDEVVALPDGTTAHLVRTERDSWDPRVLVLSARTAELIVARNDDWFAHTFTVPELGIDEYLAPQSERTISVRPAAPGTYRLECVVTGHEKMRGEVRAG